MDPQSPDCITGPRTGILRRAIRLRQRHGRADLSAPHFLDRSPARNRRRRSMSRCGNRTEVRPHQARGQAERPHPDGLNPPAD
ncbi:CGNR zinc finger domain-containing protein [Streptomyces sp. CA-210063]|uniref:CGNR zinc finger domain-containing protein n=1 Tax=Streptomyces sp. CA-210063 TaxID=2801029 RepID=UPI00214C4F54|nr:CGNR zinc finger domain-containing protein [Streptomyces sp. CA-210063]UUU37412.1 CGNR zinc finger domain-containing protein [Streptomyces sp. CA-210063]